MLKTVCISLIICPEHFIPRGRFQTYNENNNALSLFHACEVINLIGKGMTSLYVQG